MRVVVEGNLSPAGSYGIVNRNIATQLARRGHRVGVVGFDVSGGELSDFVAAHSDTGLVTGEIDGEIDVRIRQMWPPVWGRCGSERLVVIQPWEFGSIPVSWLSGVRDADAIWVPSEYCKRGYLQAGVATSKIWVVPNGVDAGAIEAPARPRRTPDATTRLLFLGGTIMRKGIDVLIAALDELDDDLLARVELTVKEVGAETFYLNQSLLAHSLELHPRVRPRVRVESRYLERGDLLDLIGDSDVLVHPYRSEGFGLGVLEAMAVGTPVIHTRGGATNEFCGASESLLIPSSLAVAETPRVGESILADRHYWYEPSVGELSALVSRLVTGDVEICEPARAARERARAWTWENVGQIAEEALDDVMHAREPRDELTLLERDLGESLSGSFLGAATLMSRLAAIGDVASAYALAKLVESRRDPRERRELSVVRERLAQLSASTPDVWSGGPYRSLIATAQHQRTGYFANAHDFEGGDEATYEIAQRLSGYLGACESILDVACGQGSMMRVCRAQGKRVQGIEADPALVRVLRADGFTVHEGFVPGDLSSLNPEPFDGVFVGHIVEHLTPSDVQALFEWIFEHVADHGTIVIQTPDFATSAVGLENFWLDATHVRPYPVRLLKSMLTTAGFVPVEGACGPVRDVAPLDVIAVGRRVARTTARAASAPRRVASTLVGHVALLSGASGFAHASRSLFDAQRLGAHGIDLVRVDVSARGDEETPADAVALRDLDDVAFDVAILDLPLGWISPISARLRASYRVARTTFEATPVPYAWRMALREFDEIWCYSRYDARILVDSGIDESRVHVVAPGVELFDSARVIAERQRTPRERFTFLSVFSFEPRKNPEALVRAFATLAARRENCDLVLKLSGIAPADLESWLVRTLTPAQRDVVGGRVKIITQTISRDALSRLYFDSDVFVLPTRGEGYGLPFLEAMAHGLTTICPDVGGHRDFCNEANSILVATTPAAAGAVAESGVFRDSLWREVDGADLVRAMMTSLDDHDTRVRLGRRALRDAARHSLDAYAQAGEARALSVVTSRLARSTVA